MNSLPLSTLIVLADPSANPFKRLDDVFAPLAEPKLGRGAQPGMGVDDSQDTQLLSQGKLVVHKSIAQTSVGPMASWRSSRSFAFTRRFGCLFLSCRPNSL